MRFMRAKSGLLALITLSTLLAGFAVAQESTPRATVTSPAGAPIGTQEVEPYTGPKRRIAVMRFDNKAPQAWDIGEGMAEQLTTALVGAGKFIVLERQAIDDVLREQEFGQSGRVQRGTEARIGKVLGAEFLVYGTITEFMQQQASTIVGGIIGNIFKGSSIPINVTRQRAHVAIDLRIVDANTGHIVNSTSVEGRAEDTSLSLEVISKDIRFGTDAFYATPIGKAVRECIKKAVDWVVQTTFASVSSVPPGGPSNVLITLDSGSIPGQLEQSKLSLRTPHGEFTLDVKDIISMELGTVPGELNITLIDGASFSGKILDEALAVRTKSGYLLKVKPADIRAVRFER